MKPSKLDDTFIALADPKRRAILKRLARGESRVTDLAAPFDVSLNAVSKHIKLLERGGLIRRRRVGREHLLRFNPKSLERLQKWINQQQSFWESSLAAIDELLEDEGETELRTIDNHESINQN